MGAAPRGAGSAVNLGVVSPYPLRRATDRVLGPDGEAPRGGVRRLLCPRPGSGNARGTDRAPGARRRLGRQGGLARGGGGAGGRSPLGPRVGQQEVVEGGGRVEAVRGGRPLVAHRREHGGLDRYAVVLVDLLPGLQDPRDGVESAVADGG